MRCSSSDVPSVVTTKAWVSPRVKSAEPCVRGKQSDDRTDRPYLVRFSAVSADVLLKDDLSDLVFFQIEEDRCYLDGSSWDRLLS